MMRDHHLIPIIMAINKNTKKKKKVGEDAEKREPSYTVGGNVN